MSENAAGDQKRLFLDGHELLSQAWTDMCLILFAYHPNEHVKLLVAANRDEFYRRPTRAMSFWPRNESLLAGKDLQAGGTWLGITRNGRLAAVTNHRDPKVFSPTGKSRGTLVTDFLTASTSAPDHIARLFPQIQQYNAFNLLVFDGHALCHVDNHSGCAPRELTRFGVYGLSNAALDTPWPKVKEGKAALRAALGQGTPDEAALFDILADSTAAADDRLPDTGVGIAWERMLSPRFIKSPDYGTRCSTVVIWDRNDRATVIERTFDPRNNLAASQCRFILNMQQP